MKKQMIRIGASLLAVLLGMLLIPGCVEKPDPEENKESQSTEQTLPPEEPTGQLALTINGTPIESYRIVYAYSVEKEAAEVIPQVAENLVGCDFDRQSAEKLRDVIERVCGVWLEVVEDSETKETPHEITVGVTDRSVTRKLQVWSIPTDGFRIIAADGCLAFGGESYGTTWHAVDAFEQYLRQALDHGEHELDIGADFRLEDTYRLLRIGCIGDSITEGWNETYFNYDYLTYPKQLGFLLWKDAVVTGYAKGGTTMSSYSSQQVFQTCLADAKNLDVVTIMLGTNDARYIRHNQWTSNSDQAFKAAAAKLVNELRKQNPEICILFLSSPEMYAVYGGDVGCAIRAVVQSQREIKEYMKQNGQEVDFFDMNAEIQNFEEYTDPDGVHLLVEGLAVFARKLGRAIQNLYLDGAPEVPNPPDAPNSPDEPKPPYATDEIWGNLQVPDPDIIADENWTPFY